MGLTLKCAAAILLLLPGCGTAPSSTEERSHLDAFFPLLSDKTLTLGASLALGSTSLLARLGWGALYATPWASTYGNECLLLSDLALSAAERALVHLFHNGSYSDAYSSWSENKTFLAHVPVESSEDGQLVQFLTKRWLAKLTGFYPWMAHWVCPCYGIFFQVHPETTSSYARNPANKLSETYAKKVASWKEALDHPEYPLILTRTSHVQNYLPSSKLIDLTDALASGQTWPALREEIANSAADAICFQRLEQNGIGAIQILPLQETQAEAGYAYLLDWVSSLGLTVNRIDLDRPLPSSCPSSSSMPSPSPSKEAFLSILNAYEPTTLMEIGTQHVLKGLLSLCSEESWNTSAARSEIVRHAFSQIEDELQFRSQNFYEAASHLELVHASLMSLLEIASPYTASDFSPLYKKLLTLPEKLEPLTTCGVHSSGMTTLAGIYKAVERSCGAPPRILFGENAYFECIQTAEKIGRAISVDEAADDDWRDADLLLGQFNPALRRIYRKITDYKVEKIDQMLEKALRGKRSKPLTLALDCTLDYIDSPRAAALLEKFQGEIERGRLNVICYRSGVKFDLFGMDNYYGAPYYMAHNRDAHWNPFDALHTDPVLQTDRLSLQWFCLAYQFAAPELEQYRRHVFENTRALLNKVPPRFWDKRSRYQIVPIAEDADASFLDIKLFGPLHNARGALAAGCFTVKSLEAGHPLFSRPSLGFYHPNISVLFGDEFCTLRLTLGLDPGQVDVLARCFSILDRMNLLEEKNENAFAASVPSPP